jgi:hypothetical protein
MPFCSGVDTYRRPSLLSPVVARSSRSCAHSLDEQIPLELSDAVIIVVHLLEKFQWCGRSNSTKVTARPDRFIYGFIDACAAHTGNSRQCSMGSSPTGNSRMP